MGSKGVVVKSSGFASPLFRVDRSLFFFNRQEISEQLVGRIAYRINHSATTLNPSGRHSNSYAGYGLLANCMIKTISEEKIKTPVVNDFESEYVAKDFNGFISSKQPERIHNKRKIIKHRMKTDIKNTGYPRVKDELDYSYLKKLRFNIQIYIDNRWKLGHPAIIISAYTDKEILLYETEIIQVVQVKGFQPHRISSYELRKDKTPSIITYIPNKKSIMAVHERFIELKNIRLSKEINIKERI